MKKVIVYLFLTLLATLLSSCASDAIRTLSSKDNIYPFESAHLSGSAPSKTYRFKEGFVNAEVVKGSVLKDASDSIRSAYGKRGLPDPKASEDAFSKTIDFLARDTINKRSSLSVEPMSNAIRVSFISGEYVQQGKHVRKGEAVQTADFPVRSYSTDGYIHVEISYPTEYKSRKGNIASQAAMLPLFPEDKINEAFEYAFSSIQISNIPFNKELAIGGEFTSQFPNDSVFANFKRKAIPGETKENGVEKGAVLAVNVQGFSSRVYVNVYPYRDISKIVYRAHFNKGYYLTPSGETNFQDFPEKEAVESIVVAIANE